jgi:snurportin-1
VQARRDLTTHARSLAFGGLADGGDADSDGASGERAGDASVRRVVSGPGLDASRMDSASAAFGELGAAADAADPDAETLPGERAHAAMDADACEPTPSGMFEASKPPKSPKDRRRSSSAPGEWSRANHGGARGPGSFKKSGFGDTQFMRPEWLVDIPNDLARAWCVLPRPEGRRELVVASRGRTVARAKTGGVSRRFASALPGGSRRTKHGKAEGDFCILDCVFHEPDATYYVLDTLAWNGVSLYDCAAEMRAAWTHAKLGHPETAECPEAGTVSVDETDASAGNAFRFSPLPVYDADARGIRNAYDGVPVPFQRDGLLFLAKDGAYELGVTPLAALWKDKRCSRHFLEENPGKADPERQRLVLSLDATTGDVVTGDAAPVALARLPLEYVAPEDGGTAPPGGGLRDGALVKFAMGDGGVFFSEDGGVLGADLVYEGLANQRRGHGADAVTKILFQYNARRNPITVEELCDAAEEQTRLGDAHAESQALRAKLFDSLP